MRKIILFLVMTSVCSGNTEVVEEATWYSSDRGNFFFSIAASESMTESVAYIFPPADATVGGQALLSDGSGVMSWGTPSTSAAHNLMSGTHTDTTNASPVQGDIIVGNATPAWTALAVGNVGQALINDGSDVSWGALDISTGTNLAVSDPVTLTDDTIGWDSTLTDDLTWSDNANATITHTFDVTGTDYTAIYEAELLTLSHNEVVTGYLGSKNFTDSAHYSGFPNRDDTTLAWDDATATLTLSPTGATFEAWKNGVVFDVGELTNTLASGQGAASGLYLFWITAPGGTPQLNSSVSHPGFDQCLVATVYWNTTTNEGLMSEERHWFGRDQWWHESHHEAIGSLFVDGMALTLPTTVTDNDFQLEPGEFYDEDLEHVIAQQTLCTVLYHDGDADWAWIQDQIFAYKTDDNDPNTGVLQYNNGNTLTNATSNLYVNYWMFISSDTVNPTHIVIGSAQHVNIASARNEDIPALGALPSEEELLIYKVTYRNTSPVSFIEATDFRTSAVTGSSGFVPSSHTALSNLVITASNHTGNPDTLWGADSVGVATEYTESDYLLVDGTRPLTANWPIGFLDIEDPGNIDGGPKPTTINALSPVAYWRMNGDLTDETVNGHDLVKQAGTTTFCDLGATKYICDELGLTYFQSTTNNYKGPLGNTNPFSVSMWVKYSYTGSGDAGDDGWMAWGTNTPNAGMNMRSNEAVGALQHRFQTTFSGGGNIIGSTQMNNGIWHHFGYTVPAGGVHSGIRAWVDGVEETLTYSHPSNVLNLTSGIDVVVCSDIGITAGDRFRGSIREVVLFENTELGESDYQAIYNEQKENIIRGTSNSQIDWTDADADFETSKSGIFGGGLTVVGALDAGEITTDGEITANNIIASNITTDGTTELGDDGDVDFVRVDGGGDLTFHGSAGFYPRRLSQNDRPAAGTGATQIDEEELVIWYENDDDNTAELVYRDATKGILFIEFSGP